MGRLAQVIPKRMVRALVRLGWQVARQSGSHALLISSSGDRVTVAMHSETLKLGTARAILKQAGLTEEEFFDAY